MRPNSTPFWKYVECAPATAMAQFQHILCHIMEQNEDQRDVDAAIRGQLSRNSIACLDLL